MPCQFTTSLEVETQRTPLYKNNQVKTSIWFYPVHMHLYDFDKGQNSPNLHMYFLVSAGIGLSWLQGFFEEYLNL
jgi:hypothetical protein